MRIVYMGTPDFAVASLERLIADGHDIAAVFTQPDKPRGRGMKLAECETKKLALERGLDVYQPASVRNFVDLKGLRAKALYSEDERQTYRKSHDNPEIIQLYKDYLGEPGSEKAHHLLHTSYVKREILY